MPAVMSSALASASLLKSEIRLAQAISEFEADLSSEQKASFRASRSQLCNSCPDPSDVMRLTAEIDRRASGRVGGGRCFGPRLTNFLQTVQQFAALGDVVVGGSQNLIACGVWSLVRVSLLLIVNFSSYLEKLSTLLMTIGRSAPRYQEMALLYPRSKDLQSHLSEYFIVVVRMCHQLLKYTQKSPLGQFASTISDSDVKTYQTELEVWANTIKDEVHLLIAKKIEGEAGENSRFRALSSKFAESVSYRQKMRTNLRVLDFCSTYDYETTWKQTRKAGNTTLFNRTAEYQDWKDRAHSCTLIYTGKLGSGKSVLLANIVDDLNFYVRKSDVVAYFFCRHDISRSLTAQTIIGSLARQLLRPIPDLAMVAGSLDETSIVPDSRNACNLLRRGLPPGYKAYFILDGLDECDGAERVLLIQQLRELQKVFPLLLCVSLRLEPRNPLSSNSDQFSAALTASIPNDNPEIESFIEAELERCIESKKLLLGHPALILKIQDALLKGSQGMFLWVSLQIESLCAMKSDDAIRQALANLPKDLSETFSRILRRCEGLGKSYQRLILELITVAGRPLTTEELREALSVVPGDTLWNPAKLLNDVYLAIASCGSLVIVDEEELTIRLVHHSVKEFLLGGFQDSTDIPFTVDDGHRKMADIIVTYLSYGIFDTRLSTMVVPQIMTASVPSQIIRSTLDSAGSVRSLALKLLHSRKRPDYDIGKTLAETNKIFGPRSVDEFHFYPYAKSYWQQHIYSSGQEPVIYDLLLKLCKRKAVKLNTTDEDSGTLLLQRAAKNGYEAVVKLLLDNGGGNLDLKDSFGQTPLSWAAANGHKAVVKLLLDTGKVDVDSKSSDGRTPLLWAAANGHEAMMKLLLDTGKVNVDSKDSRGRTPLSWAAGNGHEAVMKLLLDTGKVDVDSKSSDGQTPLLWAVADRHEGVVKLLPDTVKVNVDSKSSDGQTPLSWAAANGHEAVMKLLLDTGKVDVGSKDSRGWTPLSWAAGNGHEAVVKLLLDTGKVDVDSKDCRGQTPLSWAAEKGHEAVVKLLLDTGKVDVDSKDSEGWTPLLWAVADRYEAVVKLLLDTGKVDVDSKSSDGRTPLLWAAANGHEAMMKLLLDTGKVNVDSKDSDGRTPLSWAAGNGHEAVMKLLLDTGKVNVDSKDSDGQTPLSWAAGNGHEAVVKLLAKVSVGTN